MIAYSEILIIFHRNKYIAAESSQDIALLNKCGNVSSCYRGSRLFQTGIKPLHLRPPIFLRTRNFPPIGILYLHIFSTLPYSPFHHFLDWIPQNPLIFLILPTFVLPTFLCNICLILGASVLVSTIYTNAGRTFVLFIFISWVLDTGILKLKQKTVESIITLGAIPHWGPGPVNRLLASLPLVCRQR